jgi:hypothetical protein
MLNNTFQKAKYCDAATNLRVLTIFKVPVVAVFDADFPFRFPHAARDSGKRK